MWAQLHVVVGAPWCAGLNHMKRSESEKFHGPVGRSGGEPYSEQICEKQLSRPLWEGTGRVPLLIQATITNIVYRYTPGVSA